MIYEENPVKTWMGDFYNKFKKEQSMKDRNGRKLTIGDKVLRTLDRSVFTVLAEDEDGSFYVAEHPEIPLNSRVFEKIEGTEYVFKPHPRQRAFHEEKSELEQLVEKANEGEEAKRKLHENYYGEFERNIFSPGASSGFRVQYEQQYFGSEFRVKPKPKFEPFEVRIDQPNQGIAGFQKVKLEKDILTIGCEDFNPKNIVRVIKDFNECNSSSIAKNYKPTREGIKYNEEHILPWYEADRILEALEKAGY